MPSPYVYAYFVNDAYNVNNNAGGLSGWEFYTDARDAGLFEDTIFTPGSGLLPVTQDPEKFYAKAYLNTASGEVVISYRGIVDLLIV